MCRQRVGTHTRFANHVPLTKATGHEHAKKMDGAVRDESQKLPAASARDVRPARLRIFFLPPQTSVRQSVPCFLLNSMNPFLTTMSTMSTKTRQQKNARLCDLYELCGFQRYGHPVHSSVTFVPLLPRNTHVTVR